MAEFKEVLEKAQKGYQDRNDYPPFALASWVDRYRWNDYLRKINDEIEAEASP